MAETKPTIAITGASGFLGSKLTTYFSSLGWQVRGLVRSPERYTNDALDNIQYLAYDISQPVDDSLFSGVDYVVHAAYVKYDAKNPEALQTNLQGAKNLLAACRANNVKRTLFMSTMSAHDEAISVYGKQKTAVEALFDSPQDTIFKSGLIIGNGGIVKDMSDFMRSKHMVPLIAGGKQPLQIVGVNDLVRAVEAAFLQDAGGSYIIATPQVYTYKDFYHALAKRLNVRILYIPVPYWTLQLAFRTAALLHLPLGVGEDNLKGLKMLRAMESTDDLSKLGIELSSLDKALEEIEL